LPTIQLERPKKPLISGCIRGWGTIFDRSHRDHKSQLPFPAIFILGISPYNVGPEFISAKETQAYATDNLWQIGSQTGSLEKSQR
jgi:hypothetical protein